MQRIYRKIMNQKGAMDKLIVTLLFVVFGAVGVIGLVSWTNANKETIQAVAQEKITEVRTETSTN